MRRDERMLFSFTIFPIGMGSDVAEPVARAIRGIAESGLDYQVTGTNTVVEGTWDEVVPLLRDAIDRVTEEAPRVWAGITVDYHAHRSGRLKSSVDEVAEALHEPVRTAP